MDNIVVAGGGAAGVAAAEALRAEGFAGSLTLLCGEPELPYDRPPLSKQVLTGTWDAGRTRLREVSHYVDKGIRVVHGIASALDLAGHSVQLGDGTRLGYDGLVIATGVRPRTLPTGHDLAGVHVLRGLADTAALRSALEHSSHVVIVGAGFLGMEVCAAARTLGIEVTVVDPLAQPMIRQVGPLVGAAVAELHRAAGVVVRTGVGVADLIGENGHVTGVRLDDGSALQADCVLVAIGAVPQTEWLAGSGLSLRDGIDCDEFLRAAAGVYAAGDVASWVSPRYRRRVRVEHRMNATEMGTRSAKNLLGAAEPFDPVPYFWSDQYKVKIQVHGDPSPSDTATIEEGWSATGSSSPCSTAMACPRPCSAGTPRPGCPRTASSCSRGRGTRRERAQGRGGAWTERSDRGTRKCSERRHIAHESAPGASGRHRVNVSERHLPEGDPPYPPGLIANQRTHMLTELRFSVRRELRGDRAAHRRGERHPVHARAGHGAVADVDPHHVGRHAGRPAIPGDHATQGAGDAGA